MCMWKGRNDKVNKNPYFEIREGKENFYKSTAPAVEKFYFSPDVGSPILSTPIYKIKEVGLAGGS